jgi:hypothetical protein
MLDALHAVWPSERHQSRASERSGVSGEAGREGAACGVYGALQERLTAKALGAAGGRRVWVECMYA